jgi:hypothetical protein
VTLTGTANAGYYWTAGYRDASDRVYGIDGYMDGFDHTAPASGDHTANWIQICELQCSSQWVQFGEYEGNITGTGTQINNYTGHNHIDIEAFWYGCPEDLFDESAPTQADQAYYIYYDGRSVSSCSGGTAYEFELDRAALHSPIDYEYLPHSSDYPAAIGELYGQSSSDLPPHSYAYFGYNSSLSPTSSTAIHLQFQSNGTWTGWTPSTMPNTTCDCYVPPNIHTTNQYWSFYTG